MINPEDRTNQRSVLWMKYVSSQKRELLPEEYDPSQSSEVHTCLNHIGAFSRLPLFPPFYGPLKMQHLSENMMPTPDRIGYQGGCGSKNRCQNGTLVSGNMDQNLRNPSCLFLSHSQAGFTRLTLHSVSFNHQIPRPLPSLEAPTGRVQGASPSPLLDFT